MLLKLGIMFILVGAINVFCAPNPTIILVLNTDDNERRLDLLSDEVDTDFNVILTEDKTFDSKFNTFKKLNLVEQLKTQVNIHFTAGQRVLGDALIATKKDFHQYPTPQYAKLTLTIPNLPNNMKITFVEIFVQQSDPEGRISITNGYIGQNHIQITVEATETTYLGYTAYVYAK